MDVGKNKVMVTVEHWLRPGDGMTLQDLVEMHRDRVIKVDAVKEEVLVSFSEQTYRLDRKGSS